MMETAHHDVFHGDGIAEFVCLHQKLSVLFLGWLAVDENYHSADGIFLIEGGHVVAFYPLRGSF